MPEIAIWIYNNGMNYRILIIEDDKGIAESIAASLAGWNMDSCIWSLTGFSGLEEVSNVEIPEENH